MSPEEAKKIIKIIMEADGGCLECGAGLLIRFVKTFPEFRELAIQTFDEKWSGQSPFIDGKFSTKRVLAAYLNPIETLGAE